jgi:hypothetical protein
MGLCGEHIQEYRNTLCILQNSESTQLFYHPKQNLGGEGALRHLPLSPFTGEFWEKPTFRV